MKLRKNIIISKFKYMYRTFYLRRNLKASWYNPEEHEYYLDLHWDGIDAGSVIFATGPTQYETMGDLARNFIFIYDEYSNTPDSRLSRDGVKCKNYLRNLVDYIKTEQEP